MMKLIWWMIHDGQQYAEPLSYAKLPKAVVDKAEAILKSVTYNGVAGPEIGLAGETDTVRSERSSDSAFRTLLVLGGIAVSVLLIAIFFSLLLSSRPALVANGFRFLTGTDVGPGHGQVPVPPVRDRDAPHLPRSRWSSPPCCPSRLRC